MKKVLLSAVAALTVSASSAFAADLPAKAKPVVAPPPPAWDIAFGAAVASDYRFRGISQSNRQPSGSAYFEARYNINPDWQLYAGTAIASISFPNSAAAEVDFYAGVRPTFGKLALDIGAIYYWYPGGQCHNANPAFCPNAAGLGTALPNGNFIKKDLGFLEGYIRGIYSVTEAFQLGFNAFFTDSFLNSGASGTYASGTIKYTFPAFSNGVAFYVSGEYGYQWLGTTDSFYGVTNVVGGPGLPIVDYATWNAGFGITYKVLALDFRYIDTDLSKGECNAFTSDHTTIATGFIIPGLNPAPGLGSKWCGSTFVAKLSADLTLNQNVK
jgi:uncharacterized protein (TIGR02001 family)